MTDFFNYKGIQLAQHPKMDDQFDKILSDFDRVIEIGTHYGGLALYIYDNLKPPAEIISYDIDPDLNQIPKESNVDCRIGDCFHENIHKEIASLISEENKRVLLLCDGGHKIKEFSLFSGYLKYNDVVMIHDYADNHADFRKYADPIGWGGYDPTYQKLSPMLMMHGLQKYEYYKEFTSIFWGSFIK